MSEHPLIAIARHALEAYPDRYAPPELGDPWREPRGVFVTLKKHGALRGCVGHLAPTEANLAMEVAAVSVLAGHDDSRFPAVQPEELPELEYEISILTPPEPTTLDQLDPSRYGVIVTSGWRRGVLLPDLDGVDTVEQQIHICRQKAGISDRASVRLERFEIVKVAQ